MVSTLLNAMQVAMGAAGARSSHIHLWEVFYWFSIVALGATELIAGCFFLPWLWMVADKWVYAVTSRRKKGRDSCKGVQEKSMPSTV